MLSSVVFPAPLGPITASNSPGCASPHAPKSTCFSPPFFVSATKASTSRHCKTVEVFAATAAPASVSSSGVALMGWRHMWSGPIARTVQDSTRNE